jgi:hypothetical protein
MKQTRRKFNPEFKTKVVLEALGERLTLFWDVLFWDVSDKGKKMIYCDDRKR